MIKLLPTGAFYINNSQKQTLPVSMVYDIYRIHAVSDKCFKLRIKGNGNGVITAVNKIKTSAWELDWRKRKQNYGKQNFLFSGLPGTFLQ